MPSCPINPEAIWKLDSNGNDATGNGHNGTLFGTPAFGTGLISPGSSITFDGSDDYVNIPASAALNLTTFTWYGWFDFTNLINDTPPAALYANTDGSNAAKGWAIHHDHQFQSPLGNNRIVFVMQNDTTEKQFRTNADSITTGVHFVLVTYRDDTGECHIYIDNVDQTVADTYVAGSLSSFTYNFAIGAWTDGVGTKYIQGNGYSADQVAIYPYIFDSTQRSDVYNGGSGLDCPATVSAVLTGTLSDGGAEGEIKTGGQTIIVTVTGDTFVATVGDDNAITTALINGIDSAQSEAFGWDAVVKAGLTHLDVVRDSDTQVTIALPAFPTYEITANETITVTVPATALTGASPVVATPTFQIATSVASAALTGTLADNATEDQINAGGQTLIVTLTNDTWVSSGASFDAVRQDIINGLDSAQSEVAGWNAEVRDSIPVTSVFRTSSTVVTITLPVLPDYEILFQETITATIPASSLEGATSDIVATPTFDVTPSAGTATLSGTVIGSIEPQIREGGLTIVLTLDGDEYVPDDGSFAAIRQDIINGIDSAQSEVNGWDAAVKATIPVGNVFRTSATVCTITLPIVDGYEILLNETVTATVPASAKISNLAVVAMPSFTITSTTESATLGGTLADDASELQINAGGETLTITLSNTKWVDAGAFNAVRQDIIDSLYSDGFEANGWNAIVRDTLAVTAVVRTSDTVVTITLPAFPTFDISVTETISIDIPESACLGPIDLFAGSFSVTTILPEVDSVVPDNGPIAGGTVVIISGAMFTGATAVLFGSESSPSFIVDSDSQITAESPSNPEGEVGVHVVTPQGISADTPFDDFFYTVPSFEPTVESEPPSLQGVDPNFQAVSPGGDVFTNNGAMVLIIENNNAVSTTITIRDTNSEAPEGAKEFIPDVNVIIPAGETRWIGPFSRERFVSADNTGTVYDVTNNVMIAVIDAPENF